MCFFTEGDPQEGCGIHIWRATVMSMAVTAVVVLLFLTGTAIFRCTRVSMPSGELDGGSLGFVGFTIDPAATGEAHESLFHTVLTRIVLQAYKPNSN